MATWEPGPGGLSWLTIETEACRARLTAHGAHLCEWTPAGQEHPVLFLSPRAVFAPGVSIRGGVPVCFPWFATHPSDGAKPAHGFARTRTWTGEPLARDADGTTRLTLRLAADGATRALWPTDFAATLTFALGATLAMTFEVDNRGATPIDYEAALHTYLTVGDVARARVHGLERTRFIDKVDGMRETTAGDAPLVPAGEVDRVFLDTTAACEVEDPVLRRRIRVDKAGSRVTVVWNPGPEKGPAVADLGGDAWRRFVCVETANTAPYAVRLAPGDRHAMTATISVSAWR
ncbi:MAG: D-hexose-6-phosphate mutarotase [Candidatus Rokubacteria bacterium]|nr:D-hexose-6-phosphate mutarotase [Candidatus Rokubacteria bacterium]